MTTTIERPRFYEGQVLGAAPLNGAVEYDRGGLARHDRYEHLWGITEGLELKGEERKTAKGKTYMEVTVGPGVAVDGTGRQIVVTDTQRLDEIEFRDLNIASKDSDDWYPVFLYGQDREAAGGTSLTGACHSAEPNRFAEEFEFTFGRMADALELDQQQTVGFAAGPGGAEGSKPWLVLIGFVQWDGDIEQFTAAEDAPPDSSVERRYAGVRADEVVARGGRLTLRTAARGQAGVPAVVMDQNNGGELRFGLQDTSGTVTEVLTVNAQGDLTAKGKIIGALAGGVQVESGVAHDGMLLPLPAGITQEKVDHSEVVLHVHVTPRYQGHWWMLPLECRTEGRRVFCRSYCWGGGGGVRYLDGTCDYTLMAFAADENGDGS